MPYINPPDMTKEQFLANHGTKLPSPPTEHEVDDQLVVCLVDNGPFTAAGIAYSPEELTAFQVPTDHRPKTWFLVAKELLNPYLPERLRG